MRVQTKTFPQKIDTYLVFFWITNVIKRKRHSHFCKTATGQSSHRMVCHRIKSKSSHKYLHLRINMRPHQSRTLDQLIWHSAGGNGGLEGNWKDSIKAALQLARDSGLRITRQNPLSVNWSMASTFPDKSWRRFCKSRVLGCFWPWHSVLALEIAWLSIKPGNKQTTSGPLQRKTPSRRL